MRKRTGGGIVRDGTATTDWSSAILTLMGTTDLIAIIITSLIVILFPLRLSQCRNFHYLLLWQKENLFNVFLEVTQFCTGQLQKVISRSPQTKRRLPNLQGRITYLILRTLVIIKAALTISGVTMDDTELLRLANLRCSITILRSCRMAEVWQDEGGVKRPTSTRSSFSEALLVLYECRWMEIWYFKFVQGL